MLPSAIDCLFLITPWAVAILLEFISTGPGSLLQSITTLTTDFVKSHLPMVPQLRWAGAGLGSSYNWYSSHHVFFCRKTTTSLLSCATAEETRLLLSENVLMLHMKCSALSRQQKAVGATGNLAQNQELL